MNLSEFRKSIVSGKLAVEDIPDEDLDELRNLCNKYMKISCFTHAEMEECKELIMILIDYYTYNTEGNIIVSDYDYDQLMTNFIMNGGEHICHADNIEDPLQTRWSFVVHEEPGIVGSIKKIYSEAELIFWWNNTKHFKGVQRFRIAPKFDGVSSAIKVSGNGTLVKAVTRNDGYKGQDITKVVRNALNIKRVLKDYKSTIDENSSLWIKTELVMSSESYNECIKEKQYANRRSATIGIVNSPKNVHLAKYLTIIPLAVYNPVEDTLIYRPLNSYLLDTDSPIKLLEEIYTLLSLIRDANYPYRTDGVVIYPINDDPDTLESIKDFNRLDIMDAGIAFKVNTNEAFTTVDYGYVSIGPLGYARPMLHVHPVEVNETVVQDVSLGSFDTFAAMDLHEKEQVLIFSAGDVIPQAKLPETRYYDEKAKLIEIPKICPHCNTPLIRNKGTYRCENEDCPRVNQGRIINFISKLKAKDVSEATIEDLYNAKLIKTIPDIFHLTEKDIKSMDGYQDAKAELIVGEFQKIKSREVSISELFGALGIRGISTKKCRKIMESLGGNYKGIFHQHPEEIFTKLVSADGIGEATAGIFIDFLKENQKFINQLIDVMNIVSDQQYKGNVVFTGFRDPVLEEKFLDIGYETSNNLNANTVVVINASYDNDSTKCKAAKKKGIPVIHRSMVDQILFGLSH